MELFEKLPQKDVELINGYINHYGGGDDEGSYMPLDLTSHWLRFWNINKVPFYQMFGENFIVKKEISFDKNSDEMEEEFNELISCNDVVRHFRQGYRRFIQDMRLDYDTAYGLNRFVNDLYMLIRNEYDGETFIIPADCTKDGRPLQVNQGAKAIKMLGKICKAIGYEYTEYLCHYCGRSTNVPPNAEGNCPFCSSTSYEKIDGYETFRQLHSLALNQKRVRGNLCLSIHPMDYITMSDNDCGWYSCMQWMEEQGDYRLGTIEMMNSPYCVVAYVEAHNDMGLWSGEARWNSKRWRQLLMITPEMLLGNKQYPYFSDDLQGAAMRWLRELANAGDFRCVENQKRYGPYENEALQIRNDTWNVVGNTKVYVHFWFDYMYCDIYDYRMAFIARARSTDRIEYNLSGPAVCTQCGEVIYKNDTDNVEPHWTTCRECNNMWRCDHCGNWHSGEAYYAEDSDYPLCWYCYDQLHVCEVCGSRVTQTEQIFIEILPNADEEHECYNWSYVVDVCDDCLRYNPEFKELFGEIFIKDDMFGRARQAVSLENITDEGMSRGNLSTNAKNILKLIRDAKSDEEKLSLVKENLY